VAREGRIGETRPPPQPYARHPIPLLGELMNHQISILLRTEGALVFAASIFGYMQLGGGVWLFVLCLLLPDLAILAYRTGNAKAGATAYNLAHTYLAPGLLALAGLALGAELPLLLALIWAAHIGMDRGLGLGLKLPSGFRDTHLGTFGPSSEPRGGPPA
jgi:hypothetical protein